MKHLLTIFSLFFFLCIGVQLYANPGTSNSSETNRTESTIYSNDHTEYLGGNNAVEIKVLMITGTGEVKNVKMYLRFDGKNYILSQTNHELYTGWYVQKNNQNTYKGINVRNYSHWVYDRGNFRAYFLNLK